MFTHHKTVPRLWWSDKVCLWRWTCLRSSPCCRIACPPRTGSKLPRGTCRRTRRGRRGSGNVARASLWRTCRLAGGCTGCDPPLRSPLEWRQLLVTWDMERWNRQTGYVFAVEEWFVLLDFAFNYTALLYLDNRNRKLCLGSSNLLKYKSIDLSSV